MIAQFLIDNGLHKTIYLDKLRKLVLENIEYGTIITLYDEKGLYAVSRFNIHDKVVHVIDAAVRPDRRCKQVLIDMIKEGLIRFPRVKYLKFERGLKNKPMHLVKINKFIKE